MKNVSPDNLTPVIGVIGIGYVGLPLCVAFGKKYKVTGFDINEKRIQELSSGKDHTLEVDPVELSSVIRGAIDPKGVHFTSSKNDLRDCNIFIITAPTPVDLHNMPDLTPLMNASVTVAGALKKGDIVIYESTVFPGCTEEHCVPALEQASGLKFNIDFFCGYSPERINPGDSQRKLPNIKKITSGSTKEVATIIDKLYSSIIPAGTYKAESIKVAEAAKVIENAQRDINIAFVNELSKIFSRLGIDTHQVLNAAATKWNFLPFKPGLVGGHCIGVDPYYLAQKAALVGYYPEIILSGRRINDGMGAYVADTVIKLMTKKEIPVWNSDVLILGITFKENCPDVRNTKVIDIIRQLELYNIRITVFDPWADCYQVKQQYGIDSLNELPPGLKYNGVIVAVCHNEFLNLDFKSLLKQPGILYDVKGMLEPELTDGRL